MIKLPLVLAAVIAAGPCNAQEVRVFNGDQQHVYGPGGQILDTPELRAKNERARQMRNEQGLTGWNNDAARRQTPKSSWNNNGYQPPKSVSKSWWNDNGYEPPKSAWSE
jgi:hypothetical protein